MVAEPHHPGAEEEGRVGRAAKHFTKEQASEAKMQCSPKVTTTHRVSCDIFITEVEKTEAVPIELCVRAPPSGRQQWFPALMLCGCISHEKGEEEGCVLHE